MVLSCGAHRLCSTRLLLQPVLTICPPMHWFVLDRILLNRWFPYRSAPALARRTDSKSSLNSVLLALLLISLMASLVFPQMLWRVSAYFLLKAYVLIAFQCLRNSVDVFEGFLPAQHLFWGGMLFTGKLLQLFAWINCWTSDLWLEGRCIHRGLWLV